MPPDTEVEVVNYPTPKTLAELVVEQLTGSGDDRQMEAVIALASGLRTAERGALGILTAPARLFHRANRWRSCRSGSYADRADGHDLRFRHLAHRALEGFGVDLDLHPLARLFHVGLVEARAPLAEQFAAELVARHREVGRR